MDLGKHTCDIALGYATQRSNWVKDMVLPPIDDLVQPVNLLLERMPIEVKNLKQETEVERRATRKKNMRHQNDLGQRQYNMEIQIG